MHDTIQYIEKFDVALLTETRSASYEMFQTHQHFSLPVTDSGKSRPRCLRARSPSFSKGGQLVEIAARGLCCLGALFCISLWARQGFVHGVCVHSAPGGSQQLQLSVTCCSSLSSCCQIQLRMLCSMDMLFLGGDFNAKVASRNDISGSDMDFLEDSGVAYHRGMSSPRRKRAWSPAD